MARERGLDVDLDTILGVAMIVMGVLVLFGEFTVSWLLPVLGIVLVVMGALMLLGLLAGGTLTGLIVLVVGVLLYGGYVGIPDAIVQTINTIAGVVLIVLGVMQIS